MVIAGSTGNRLAIVELIIRGLRISVDYGFLWSPFLKEKSHVLDNLYNRFSDLHTLWDIDIGYA